MWFYLFLHKDVWKASAINVNVNGKQMIEEAL